MKLPLALKQGKFTRFILFIICLLCYANLFWHQKFGINLVLFLLLLSGVSLWLNPEALHAKKVWVTAFGTVFSGVFVIIYNSGAAVFAHTVSFLFLLGFLHGNRIQTVTESLITVIESYIRLIPVLLKKMNEQTGKRKWLNYTFNLIKLLVVPLVVLWIFQVLYRGGSPIFNDMMLKITSKINVWLIHLFENFSVSYFFFLAFGSFFITGVLVKTGVNFFVGKEAKNTDNLVRIRKPKSPYANSNTSKCMGLKKENRSALIMISMINILLLVVNVIDIKWIWFDFQIPENFSLKQFVHEGTWLLVLSIFLSIAILLYFFRGNQNFYSRNKPLKILSYFWIFQNFILGVSVFLRNYHYIDFHGLAYLRIGVMVFLVIVLIGLISLYLKIKQVNSFYYLFKVNTWAMYGMLLLITAVNWDIVIVKYNLNHPNQNEIDIDNYLNLSPKTLPIIYENLYLVEQQIEQHKQNKQVWVNNLNIAEFKSVLDTRKKLFLAEQENYNWSSWNWADWHTKNYFLK